MSSNSTILPTSLKPAWKPLLAITGAVALGACATAPAPLTGTYTSLKPAQVAQSGASGTHVRWGGQIIKTQPEAQQTCFVVLSRSLDVRAQPVRYGADHGRFIACHQGYYDPEVFAKGREVTFTGTVYGVVPKTVGKHGHAYALLNAQTVYLWPRRPRLSYNVLGSHPYISPNNPKYGPFFPAPPPPSIINRSPPQEIPPLQHNGDSGDSGAH